MIYVLSFLLFQSCYWFIGHPLANQERTWNYTGWYRYFSILALISLPALIVAGGYYALLGSALAGLLLGAQGRKLGLELRNKKEQD